MSRNETAMSPAARIAIFAMAIGSFAIGTGEFAIMGMLPTLAQDLGVSEPDAGHLISAYAFGVVVGAPLVSILFARAPRRLLLLVLMGLFALGNFGSALAPEYVSVLVLRFLSGLPHGAYFGIAALVAASMVDHGYRARAVGRVMLGLTLATLVGLPAASWMGQFIGWRSAFVAVGVIGVACVLMMYRFLPRASGGEASTPLQELGVLRRPQVWLTLAIGAIACGGVFSVFTYVVPLLTEVSGVPVIYVPLVLALFGAGMTIANTIGAFFADKALMPTIGGLLVFNTLVLGSLPFTALYWPTAALSIFLIGFTVAICTALQTRLMDVARDGQTLAATLNHAAFNIANALGALFGGMAISAGLGWASTGVVGALMAVAGLLVFSVSVLLDRIEPRTQAVTS